MTDSFLQEAIVYHVRPVKPEGHLFEVTCRIEVPSASGQILSLPAWIPGSYLVRDYAGHVVRVEAEARGEPIPIHKVDKQTWRVSPTNHELICRAFVYAADRSVRGAWLDERSGFFNGVCLFFRAHGFEDKPCVVHIDPPATRNGMVWQLATSMERLTGTRYDFGAFRAENYRDLIDHPVLMGMLASLEFEVGGVPHTLAIEGRHEADEARLRRDIEALCTWHLNFFGGPPPMDRYWFLLRAVADGYGGLEHRFSSALVARRDGLPRSDQDGVDAGYRRFLGLVSHEYFHSWHVKRIQPAEFVGSDLSSEAYTRQLWVFEGITSYYDDLALLRSGLITTESYLELLGRALTRFYRTPGRRHQTLEEASFDAWIKFYRPDENSGNATVSYYLKGALVALALDLELRLRTDGACSLDDVMQALWREHGEASDAGLPYGGFERLVQEVAGRNMESFFQQCLRTTVDPPLGILLSQFGIRLNMRSVESPGDLGGSPGRPECRHASWLGMKTRSREGALLVATVIEGGPAQKAGLAAGDEILALDGYRVRPDSLDALLSRCQPGQHLPVHFARNDELLLAMVEPAEAPRDTCYLTMDAQADPEALRRRVSWLGTR